MSDASQESRLFTFSSGGWVALTATIICLGLLTWAIGPAMLRAMQRPPGDGRNVDRYGFDLSTLHIDRATFVPVMLHRDMVPTLSYPPTLTLEEAERLTEEERGKFLVSTDRVIGIEINGEARAYPIQLMTVHELVNDSLGGIPILISYSWLGDVPRAFDRRVGNETLEFGVSGMITNANTLMYDRRLPDNDVHVPWEERGESLWRQLDGNAVSGPAAEAELTLTTIPAQLVSWRQWKMMHPETTVLARDPTLLKRYRRSTPTQYFRSADIPYPIDPLVSHDSADPHSTEIKDRVLAIRANDGSSVWTYRELAARARQESASEPDALRTFTKSIDGHDVTLTYDPRAETFAVDADAAIDFVHCFWFLWYAHHNAGTH